MIEALKYFESKIAAQAPKKKETLHEVPSSLCRESDYLLAEPSLKAAAAYGDIEMVPTVVCSKADIIPTEVATEKTQITHFNRFSLCWSGLSVVLLVFAGRAFWMMKKNTPRPFDPVTEPVFPVLREGDKVFLRVSNAVETGPTRLNSRYLRVDEHGQVVVDQPISWIHGSCFTVHFGANPNPSSIQTFSLRSLKTNALVHLDEHFHLSASPDISLSDLTVLINAPVVITMRQREQPHVRDVYHKGNTSHASHAYIFAVASGYLQLDESKKTLVVGQSMHTSFYLEKYTPLRGDPRFSLAPLSPSSFLPLLALEYK